MLLASLLITSLLHCACANNLFDPVMVRRPVYKNYTLDNRRYIFEECTSWPNAVNICRERGGHLANLNSSTEANDVNHIMKKEGANSIHVGFHDLFTDKNYVNLFGTNFAPGCTVGSPGWAPTYPRENYGYDCGGYTKKGFIDEDCEMPRPFICVVDNGKWIGPTPGPGYEHVPGHNYYKYHNIRATWPEAEKICRDEGTHLVILNSEAEAEALEKKYKTGPSFFTWVGVHRVYGYDLNFITLLGGKFQDTGLTQWRCKNQPLGNFMTDPYVAYKLNNSRRGLKTECKPCVGQFVCEFDLKEKKEEERRREGRFIHF